MHITGRTAKNAVRAQWWEWCVNRGRNGASHRIEIARVSRDILHTQRNEETSASSTFHPAALGEHAG